jgi:hypothetical protein
MGVGSSKGGVETCRISGASAMEKLWARAEGSLLYSVWLACTAHGAVC